MKGMLDTARLIVNAPAHYVVRLARNADEIRAAQVLRFEVFNLELNEGLSQSYATGFDEDPFDAVCDHLLVEHLPSQQIIGTYRVQTGASAARNLGYYCAQEFEFSVYEPLRGEMIELGRACVHRQHQNLGRARPAVEGHRRLCPEKWRALPVRVQFHHIPGRNRRRLRIHQPFPASSGRAIATHRRHCRRTNARSASWRPSR